jgi:hypothetical protein
MSTKRSWAFLATRRSCSVEGMLPSWKTIWSYGVSLTNARRRHLLRSSRTVRLSAFFTRVNTTSFTSGEVGLMLVTSATAARANAISAAG